MQELISTAEWDQALSQHKAFLVLFGGKQCGVCQVIKPQLEAVFSERFPKMKLIYIDCQTKGAQLCAGRGIFSLPVVQLYFDGKLFNEFVRAFSIQVVAEAAARPYQLQR
ncbi:thioredoxin family protein [Marinospirillum sp.]|uniref:thioredoxin family protein n=1 Tax=Marinospirillum sp. TaxID=2183934 RepID=UPI003850B156